MPRASPKDRYGEGYAAGYLEGFRKGLASVTLPDVLAYRVDPRDAACALPGCLRCGVSVPPLK